jgi:hypothetical protein
MVAEAHQEVGEDQPRPELRHPFFDAVIKDSESVFPSSEQKAFEAILTDINHQAVKNFMVWRSGEYADTGFSATSIVPDRKMVKHAINPDDETAGQPSKSLEKPKKRIFWFIEPYFHMGKLYGGPFSMINVGTDRAFRELTQVARDPQLLVRADLLGSPIGFRGGVGKRFTQEVVDDGFNAYGKLYAEYIEQVIGEMDENTRIVINGSSRGAVTAEKTYHFLIQRLMQTHSQKMHEVGQEYGPEEEKAYREFLYQHIQGLYDEPAGVHKKDLWLPFKAANEAGLMAEDIVRRKRFKEPFLSPEFDVDERQFLAHFGMDVAKYTPEDLSRINRVAMAEAYHLALGNPQNQEEPGHNRLPLFDPTNTRPGRIIRELFRRSRKLQQAEREEWENEESKQDKGRKRTTVIKRLGHYHAFWRDSYARWEKNIAAVRRWAPNPS